jgi:hypothetical protein
VSVSAEGIEREVLLFIQITGFIHFGAHIIPDYSRLSRPKFDQIQDYF